MSKNVWSQVPADMPLVLRAVMLATKKHAGQVRKYTGEPYVVHCLEVAHTVSLSTMNPHVVAAAVLHDTLEDTDTTFQELVTLSLPIAEMVQLLTDTDKSVGNRRTRKQMDRERLAAAPAEVQTIKVADLLSNTPSIVAHDPNFARVYLDEKELLLEVLTKADLFLQAQALGALMESRALLG